MHPLAVIDVALITTIGVVGGALISALVTGIVKIIWAIGEMRASGEQSAFAASQQRLAATREVKQKIAAAAEVSDAKTDAVKKVADSTHSLVNGAHGAALKTIVIQADKIVALTSGTDEQPAAVIASGVAKEALEEHNAATETEKKPSTDLSNPTP